MRENAAIPAADETQKMRGEKNLVESLRVLGVFLNFIFNAKPFFSAYINVISMHCTD